MSAITLSIIIVAYKNKSVLNRCIASIPKNPSWELIVHDNSHINYGFAVGCNRAAKQARGKFILFLNPDCIVDGNSLQILIDHLEKHPSTGMVAPKIIDLTRQPQLSYSLQPTFITSFFVYSFLGKYLFFLPMVKNHWFNRSVSTDVIHVGTVTGAAFMIRNSLFKQLKGFDERFFLYWEETDLCRRCLASGKKVVFEPNAEIIHEGAACTPKDSKLAWRWFRQSRLYFFKKHYGILRGCIVESFLRLSESVNIGLRK